VTTAARRTGSANRVFDPGVDVIRQGGPLALDELKEELAVSLRARQP